MTPLGHQLGMSAAAGSNVTGDIVAAQVIDVKEAQVEAVRRAAPGRTSTNGPMPQVAWPAPSSATIPMGTDAMLSIQQLASFGSRPLPVGRG